MLSKKRARSLEAKLKRETAILTATENLMRQSSYNEITIQAVANSAGLAKGTIYLYFTNRDSLIIGVHGCLFDRWIDRFSSYQSKLKGFDCFCDDFAKHYVEDPLFVKLTGFAEAFLEPQLDRQAYIKVRRAKARRVKKLAGIACTRLGASPEKAQKLIWGFLTSAAGAAQSTIETAFDNSILPDDVSTFNDLSNFHLVFRNAATSLVAIIE